MLICFYLFYILISTVFVLILYNDFCKKMKSCACRSRSLFVCLFVCLFFLIYFLVLEDIRPDDGWE